MTRLDDTLDRAIRAAKLYDVPAAEAMRAWADAVEAPAREALRVLDERDDIVRRALAAGAWNGTIRAAAEPTNGDNDR